MIVDKQIDFFWLIVSMGHSLGSQIEPVGRPGPHKAAKSTQQGCQEQADRAIRGQMDPARAPGAARSSQLRPDRASQGGPGRLAGRPADCATAPAGQLDKPRRAFSIWIDSIETCRHRWEGGRYSTPPRAAVFFGCGGFGSRTDSERTPYTPLERIPNGPRTDPARTPRGPRTDPRRIESSARRY